MLMRWVSMKTIDWQMIYFVSVSLIKEYWYLIGLPRVYYWEVKKKYNNFDEEDDSNKAA